MFLIPNSFRTSIAIATALFCAAITVAVGLVVDGTSSRMLHRQAAEQLSVRVAERHSMLVAYLRHQEERLELVANHTRLRKLLVQTHRHEIEPAAFRDESRRILVDAMQSISDSDDPQNAGGRFLSISIVNSQGVAVTSTDQQLVERDFSQHEVFRQGAAAFYFGLPEHATDDAWTSLLAAPINTQSDASYIAVVQLDAGPLVQLLQEYDVVDERAEVLVAAYSGRRLRYLLPPRGDSAPTTLAAADAPAMTAALHGQRGVMETTNHGGVPVLAAFQPVRGKPWGLVVQTGIAEVYAPLTALRQLYFAVVPITFGLGAVGGWQLAICFTRHFVELFRTKRRIAPDDIPVRAQMGTQDEVGHLTEGMNHAAECLAASHVELEDRVQQRTAELEASNNALKTEIEQRRSAEAARRQSEERLDLAIRGTSDGLWDWWIDSNEVWLAPRFKELLGYADNELASTFASWEERLHPDDHAPTIAAVHRHLQDNDPYDVEYRLRTKSGEYRWFRARGMSVRDEDGHAVRMSGSIQDVTLQKTAEAALRRTAAELKQSNRELEQFAYVASHDLKEPLRMVASFTRLLADEYQGRLDEQADTYIYFATDGAKRMQALIDDLLTYSRIGRAELASEEIDLTALLQAVLGNLSTGIDTYCAEVEVAQLPTVSGHAPLLLQLFQNLISNAIKFHGDRPPVIRISCDRQVNEFVFAVADNGIGIAPEQHERVFQMFQRLHGRGEYEGTGIGLAVCRKIVERHGGRIWIESVPGEGATFYFTLPVKHTQPLTEFLEETVVA